MRYTAKRISNGLYELINELGQPSGSIRFNTWSMSKAKATTSHDEYDFYSVGFWQMKKAIVRNGIQFAELAPRSWKGFDITFQNHGKLFFKKKSFWTGGEYILVDENGTTFANINMVFNWKRFGYKYDIEVQDNMIDAELKSILPFIMFYTAIIMLRRRQAAG